ncbi:hypothetical protein QKU48_gp0872 [Fadolivirus algeromassiliense]|jgi:hypothetical protein|uniref:Uncharacterized protein n=1 Tax=Fadolivirus FV1/VV64 TaxID=3070911 RepID=A0A7D3UTG7_9VIRU|nr:hypothetical protein QKU48_gp0872 [Fadolivirus algeromassiliense]QKF94330.1 hypothetical protein Fadolivirus_1_872 [Fadolivirus FV1/VV64]
MYLILFVVLLIIIVIGCRYFYGLAEHFTLFTANPINLVSVDCINNAPRHIKFNQSRGIEYVSNYPPTKKEQCMPTPCPENINKGVTLGDDNLCWNCKM